MEAIVIIIIGSVLIVILKKLPQGKKNVNKHSSKSILKLFSSFKKHQEEKPGAEEVKKGKPEESISRLSDKEELIKNAEKFLENGKLKEAEDLYIEVLKINKKNTQSYKGLGQICLKKKDYKDALEVYKKLIELAPNDPSNYNNLGMCYFKKRDYRKALENYKKALEIEDKPSYYKNIGITQEKLKKYKEAFESLEKSLKIGGKDEDSITLILKILPKIKNNKKVKELLKFLLRLDPDNTLVKNNLARLK